MSYNLGLSSLQINGSGHLIVNFTNGSSQDLGQVVGTAGASGDLFTPVAKTASYTVIAGDLNGQTTPVLVFNPTSASVVCTIDPALLWQSATNTSLAILVKYDPAYTGANTVTVTPKTGATLEGGASGVGYILPSQFSYTIIAKNATTLLII